MGNIGTYINRPGARLSFDVAIVVLIYLAPWYISALLVVVGMVFVVRYYEAIVLGLLLDLLYAPSVLVFPKFAIAFLILFVILEGFIKRRLRLYGPN